MTQQLTKSQDTSNSLTIRPGRWIDGWNPEDRLQWESEGRYIAKRNLNFSIFCEFLGFVVWQLWSVVVVFLTQAGFQLSSSEIFWLISLPSLVGATLRIPYTFMVPIFGGRNWTIVSALLLLIPLLGLGWCVSDPHIPFWIMLIVAGLAGFGGGNFASSMANITFFYPAREKGWALGLNAAGGNLGSAVAQLAVPIVVTLGAAATVNLSLAAWVWVPLVLLAAWCAWRFMDNLSHAKGDLAGVRAAASERQLWVMCLLYIGTFGSFIGFSGVFPKLIKDVFPEFSAFSIGSAAISLAFLGPLVGSLARPYGGRLADRFSGARITVLAFAVMAVAVLSAVWTLPLKNFWLFLGLFLILFAASGVGNGSTYRMIPMIFAAKEASLGQNFQAVPRAVSAQRKAAAALGLISGVGAYGGFFIPQLLSLSLNNTKAYDAAFYGFVVFYALMLLLCWFNYLRRGSVLAKASV